MVNLHSHSQFCDGRATIEEFVQTAIELGFSRWGVSPHSPLPMMEYAPWALSIDMVDSYIDEVDRLKVEYGDKIDILTGMEIDYIDDDYNPNNQYFQSLKLDYRIGSIHLVRSPRDGSLLDIDCKHPKFIDYLSYHFDGDLRAVVEDYYRASREMIECGGFDFIAHHDKISNNASLYQPGITDEKWYRKLAIEFIELCASRDIVMEINTKQFVAQNRFYPDQSYFKIMEQLGIRVVINSDVHHLDKLPIGLSEAHELYKGEILTSI